MPGPPSGERNQHTADIAAWVPVGALDHPIEGMPMTAHVTRSMGLVPDALRLFFGLMWTHYRVARETERDIERPQMELIAARVSALNECFY